MDHTTKINEALRAEEQLAANLSDHMGEWVAVRDHAVVSHADSLRDLLADTKEIESIDRIPRGLERVGRQLLLLGSRSRMARLSPAATSSRWFQSRCTRRMARDTFRSMRSRTAAPTRHASRKTGPSSWASS